MKNFFPMTMHHGRCHWSRPNYQVLMRMLMQKRPLLAKIANLWNVAGQLQSLHKAPSTHIAELCDQYDIVLSTILKSTHPCVQGSLLFDFVLLGIAMTSENRSRFVVGLKDASVIPVLHPIINPTLINALL